MKVIAIFVLSAVAYVIAGKVGGFLSVPPGFASAVWPASGVALALALRFQVLPVAAGAWLGNFIINLSMSSEYFTQVTVQNVGVAACVGLAAAAQLLAGYYLFRRLVGSQMELTVARSIASFVFIVALTGCLVSSSISTLALCAWDVVPVNVAGFIWVTWWVGDSLGVLFFTPFLLTLLTPNSAISKFQKVQVFLPTTVIFLCTWIMFSTSQEWQKKTTAIRLENESLDIFQYIRERMQSSGDVLAAYDAFLNSVPEFDRTTFDQFTQVMLKNSSALYGVGWTAIVPHAQRASLEQAYREQGFANFELTELTDDGQLITAQQQSEYFPVLYIHPLDKNRAAFGLNLAANEDRREALRLAKSLAKPVATAPIVLAQEYDNENAIIVYRPVFNERSGQFIGYVSGVIRAEGLIGKALDLLDYIGFSLVLTDITKPNQPLDLIRQRQPQLLGFPTFKYFTNFGERNYQIDLYANTQHQMPTKNWVSWAVLTGGFFIAALTQMFVLSVMGNHGRIRHEVDRKTQDLKTQTELANQASRAKSDFLSNMSHELRTPLNAIIGLINLCLKTELNRQQSDYLHKASLASNTLLSLINQTLDHAKIEAGRMELNQSGFSLSYMLLKLQAVFEQSTQDKDIHFSIVSGRGTPDQVIGDELRIEQILINLLGNAFKFTDRGQITLSVEYVAKDTFAFAVRDTGCGIPEAYKKELFTAFTQVDSSTSRIFGGTGLGLSISSKLAAMMQGQLELVSSDTSGSCFRVTVPLQVEDHSQVISLQVKPDDRVALPSVETKTSEVERRHMIAESLNVQPLLGQTILLVEDIEINQMVAGGILQGFGAQVIIANNGQESLTLLAENDHIDLVLMDVQMPVMDGYEATMKIRQQSKYVNLPILAMTANAMEQDVKLCLQAGMNGHISKPIDAKVLLEKILQSGSQAA